jgi:hypothetical protein
MKILVSDTSVLIDLERGGFLDSCFKLPFEFAVPDLLYARELESFGGPELIARGLRVEALSGDEVIVAQAVRSTNRKLSLPDAFAYSLASRRGWTLLSGDGELRALAEAQRVTCYGVLWLVDQFFGEEVIEAKVIVTGLEAMQLTHATDCHAQKSRFDWNGIAGAKNKPRHYRLGFMAIEGPVNLLPS